MAHFQPGPRRTAFAIAPVVLGPLCVVAGAPAVWKGAQWRGTTAVSVSGVAVVVGYCLAAGLAT